jgi:hypothetical protein
MGQLYEIINYFAIWASSRQDLLILMNFDEKFVK